MPVQNAEKGNVMRRSQSARRKFLLRAALTLTGTCAAAALSRASAASPKRATKRIDCRTLTRAPMLEVEGKVAFITGGSSGIGLGIARAFSDAGMKIVIGFKSDQHLAEALTSLKSASARVQAIRVDVTDRPAMERAASDVTKLFGKVHVLVNNAGVFGLASLRDTTYDDWDWVMNVNVNGVFNGVRAFLPLIQKHGEGGQIVTVASAGGLIAGSGMGSYISSKFAVVGMMEALRSELTDQGIGVSICCPGAVASNILSSARNRPSTLANSGFDRDAETRAELEGLLKNPLLAMDPLDIGRLVLRGVRNNELYIITHPEYKPLFEARSMALTASIPTDVHPSDARSAAVRASIQSSIYVIETNRTLCSKEA
jgi:NAD(P)-dependent dehydrogenase (short-subunit alcohol dehydrogenase family)